MPSSEANLAELVRRHSGSRPLPAATDLTAYELGVYSQNGEDGVLAELLARIGSGRREFVEFGVETGVEGNCVALADLLGWSGLFIEGDPEMARALASKYRGNARVRTLQARVTAENVDELFAANGVSAEPDVLSIDVDGNDLWVWRALTHCRSRIVVIEYNAHLDHAGAVAQPYDPDWAWQGTDWFGASLGALELVGRDKGYALVHTELAGVNAFFVRDDLLQRVGEITPPRRPPNYDGRGGGHPPHPGGGRYVEVG